MFLDSVRQIRSYICLGAIVLGCLYVGLERLFLPQLPARAGLLLCLGFGIVFWMTTSPTFFRKYVGEATPASLGTIRAATCIILLLMTLGFENLSSITLLPVEMYEPVGMMRFFYLIPGSESFIKSQFSLKVFEWLTALILFLGVIGWRTRIVIPFGTFFYFIYGGILRDYTFFWHQGLIPFYVMVVLSLTPCGDGFSVDQLRKKRRRESLPVDNFASPIYGWSRYACWVVVALTYVAGGLSKLRNGGPFWWEPINVQYQLYSTSLGLTFFFDKPLSLYLNHNSGVLFAMFGIVGIYGELAYGLVLFSKKARWLVPPLMGMTHIGIFLFQDILFFDLICLPLIFLDFTTIQKVVSRKVTKQRSAFDYHSTPTAKNNLTRLYYPSLVSVLAAILLTSWFLKVESYPFSAVQMFSKKNTSGRVIYAKVLARYESGMVSPVVPEKIIPATFDNHYAEDIKGCFLDDLKRRHVCEKLLETVGSVYNREESSKEKMTEIEVQEWQYDFIESRSSDSNYGKLMKHTMIEIN